MPTLRALRVPLLCCLIMVIQGIETFSLTYIAPLLAADRGLDAEQLGIVFAATVVGTFIGALGIAPLSDRVGRRPVLAISVLLTGAPSLLLPSVESLAGMVLLRAVVGLGFGAAMPVAAALASEHAPDRHRALLVTATSTSVVVGMGLAGLVSGFVMPAYGWKMMLWGGGVVALFVAGGAAWLLPRPQAAGVAVRSAPASWRMLLRGRLLAQSLLLCLTMTMSFLVLNFAVYWLPTLLHNEGFSVRDTGLIGATRQFVTVLAGLAVGWWMDRAGVGRVLAICHGVAVMLLFAIAPSGGDTLAALLLLLAGMSVLSAALSGSLALVSESYEPALRATALGWVLGVARVVGGTLGTYVGGLLMGAGWQPAGLALGMGAAALIGALALFVVLTSTQARGFHS